MMDKDQGAEHYKTGDIEPIDLFKSGNMLWDNAIGSIIRYAFRCRKEVSLRDSPFVRADMEKIKHYADIVISLVEEKQKEKK